MNRKSKRRIISIKQHYYYRIQDKGNTAKKNISIEYLANSSDMDYSQLARMELASKFSLFYLFRVAEALGVTPKDLLP
ncbi:MAG: helix-turn-helix transcriptional regulator [Chitinophagaceae bacterium]|nr:helix-turn-helix transcriptional regulator [Chitinophagaceae bacterium]